MASTEVVAKPDSSITGVFGPALKVGAASASVGFLFGGTVGILKNYTPLLFATASSIRCFGLGTSFWAARGAMLHAWTTTEAVGSSTKISASSVAGGLSGGIIAAITRSRSNVLPGILMWSFLGGIGQWAAIEWNGRDRTEAKVPLLQKIANSSWSPIQAMTDEDYAKILAERMLKVDVEISILDDKIAALRRQQQAKLEASGSGDSDDSIRR